MLKRFVVPLSRTQQSMPQRGKGNFDSFLQKVREGTREEVEQTLRPALHSHPNPTERSYRQKPSDALEAGDAYEVWKLHDFKKSWISTERELW